MAGHSHWAGMKHKKGRVDQQRSKIFSKLSKEITVAAKLGAKDPGMNPRLRAAIQTAKQSNMPKDNIERAIKKSTYNEEINYENLRYEGFGPEKICFIVETLTDNKNRTVSNIRSLFQKFKGSMGEMGTVSHQFKQIGVIRIEKDKFSEEEIIDLVLKAGGDDCITNKMYYEVTTKKENFYKIKSKFEEKIEKFISSEIEWVPLNKVTLKDENYKKVTDFIDILENDDDVQKVYTNLNKR